MPDIFPAAEAGNAAQCLCVRLSISAEAAFAAWALDPFVAWLDSGGAGGARARFSYLAVDPFEVTLADPFGALDRMMARFAQDRRWGDRGAGDRDAGDRGAGDRGAGPVPFTGGAVGFLGYELGAGLERVPRHPLPASVPACCVGFYDVVLAFDHARGEAWLLSSGLPETSPQHRAARARARADSVLERLAAAAPRPPVPVALAWQAETRQAVHEARVARTIAYIEAGDIYQANITAAFHAARPEGLAAADIFLALRAANPAPFAAFIGAGNGCAVASVSPERFLSLDRQGGIEARPIKGTRPRDADPARDAALLTELLASPKDRAENLMIVDLLRNDIARVAEPGSVRVPELALPESFARVHHLVSSVRGQLRAAATATDLLRAAFPGGSITGAPKLRAMEIIHELEPSARGPYCGSVFWMGWDGAMDSSVAIRTATITRERVTIQAGGGIVADSDPAAEYEELLVKARPLLRALGPWSG